MTMEETQLNYSTRLLRKGAFIEETYRVFAHWDFAMPTRENLSRICREKPLGAPNESWLREITTTLSSRFSHGDSIEPLVKLAKARYPIERWRYCLLWHFASTDGLYRRFSEDFLFAQLRQGVAVLSTEVVMPFIERLRDEGLMESDLSSYAVRRGARDLLRMAAAFGLLEGQPIRRFTHNPIPEDALLYGLYDLMDRFHSVDRAIRSERWRLFLLTAEDVEHELLNLHQYRRLHFEVAGTVRELSLPYASLLDFTRSLAT